MSREVWEVRRPGGAPNIKVFAALAVLILLLIVAATSWDTVPAGHRGVRLRFGKPIEGALPEGLVVKVPFAEEIVKMEVREKKFEEKSNAASKDLQTVSTTVALNYMVLPESADRLFVEIGLDYENRVIVPALHEALKAVTAKFTAEELITQREEVRSQVEEGLRARFISKHLKLLSVAIKDFNFSAEFNRSIEDKQTEEQRALRAQHELNRKKTEAEQQVVSADAEMRSRIKRAEGEAQGRLINAKAEAEAIDIKAKAEADALKLIGLAATDKAIHFRALEKWDGVLPRVTGGAIPFIDVGKDAEAPIAK